MIFWEWVGYLLAKICGLKRVIKSDGLNFLVVNRLIPSWAAAQTWGRNILILEEGLDHDLLIEHEKVHVAQWKQYGILFPIYYLSSSIKAWLRGEDPYKNNIYEEEARLLSSYPSDKR